MSSKLLLRGRKISKIYGSPLSPLLRLKSALLKREPEGKTYNVLSSVNLDIYRGETVGIMGRNGAGKSTLLGILGGVIPATSGSVERIGSMAVLLELGAGFNHNLSGVENARIYCRMMGVRENKIEAKLKFIEKFADLDEYFHLPVRTYSSGMYSRLGFSTAVHVDADMVIIDETLSVGDASFKMKCYDKIDKMKSDGVTFLLVSHSQNLIANFCTRAIVIDGGEIKFDGAPLDAVGIYKQIRADVDQQRKPKVVVDKSVFSDQRICKDEHKFSIENIAYREKNDSQNRVGVISLTITSNSFVRYPGFSIGIRNSNGIAICSISTADTKLGMPELTNEEKLDLDIEFNLFISPGVYFVSYQTFELVGDVQKIISVNNNVLRFDVVGKKNGHGIVDLGMVISRSVKALAAESF